MNVKRAVLSEFIASIESPDVVGSSEYRSVCELLNGVAEATEHSNDDDSLDIAEASLVALIESATEVLASLRGHIEEVRA